MNEAASVHECALTFCHRETLLSLGSRRREVALVQRIPRVQPDEPQKSLLEFSQRIRRRCDGAASASWRFPGVPLEMGERQQYAQSVPLFAARERTPSGSFEQWTAASSRQPSSNVSPIAVVGWW